ncbi:hypothetical protein RI129_007239 [Pyrocoelia pectoralis]|uniref:Connectin n=1 Tax=Pyrocoelia pectoralis TaxID=417401 RepID=A0AAN7VG70_9COLE
MRRVNFAVKFYFILILLTCVLAKLKKEKERKKVVKLKIENNNLCTIEGNSAPFHCFCSDGTSTTNATKAKCWVFSGLTPEHSLWTLFSTQPHIIELNVMVTPMGELSFIPTNGINNIHPYALANLTKIHEIRLAKNRILTLNPRAFAHLLNLSLLDLDENRIFELNRDVFVDLPLLKKLFLKQNNLSAIQEGAFRQLGHLVELELSTNSISILTKDTFAGLGELKKLFLSYNKIIMLGDLTFAELWILEELDLEGNQIEFISDRAFAGLTHLTKLNLSYNKLKNLRSNLLDGVPAITNFDLRHNQLETLTFDNVKPILHNFYNESGYFYLTSNKFVCDCRLAWMHILRNETKNQVIRETLDELMCHLPTVEHSNGRIATKSALSYEGVLNRRRHPSEGFPNTGSVGEGDDDNLYDEDDDDYQQESSLQNRLSILQKHDPYLRHLLQIPLSELPCANETKSSTQSPRIYINTPSYAEINANRCLTTIGNFPTVLSCCILICVCLT